MDYAWEFSQEYGRYPYPHIFLPNIQERTHTKQCVPYQSTFDPQSPVCLTSVNVLYHPQAQYTSLARAWLEVVHFNTVHGTVT